MMALIAHGALGCAVFSLFVFVGLVLIAFFIEDSHTKK